MSKRLNILIPMAGIGSRFSKAGYKLPKPLINVFGKAMIQRVIENLTPVAPHRFIFICQCSQLAEYNLQEKLQTWCPGAKVLGIDYVTEGAACTVMLAREFIDNNEPLMIANCDQWIEMDINQYLKYQQADETTGLIMTMYADDPKWSYVERDEKGYVIRVVEKEVISNHATVGIYNFSKGSDFVSAAEEMIGLNDRVNNEFYVAPVYNYLIKKNRKILAFNVDDFAGGMHGLGTPEDLNKFILKFAARQRDFNLN